MTLETDLERMGYLACPHLNSYRMELIKGIKSEWIHCPDCRQTFLDGEE